MNILLIGPVPSHLGSKNHGGVAQQVWSLAKKLSENHTVSILAVGRYYRQTRKVNGIRIFGFANSFGTWKKMIGVFPKLFSRMGKAPTFKQYMYAVYSLYRIEAMQDMSQFDIIHIHRWENMALFALELLNINTPKVVTIHSYSDFYSLKKQETERRIDYLNRYLGMADGVLHVSETDRKKGYELGFSFGGLDEVVHNGVDKPVIDEVHHRSRVCFVGSLIYQKRISLLLDAIPYVNTGIEEFHIIGEGSEKKKVESAAELGGKIIYRGVLPNKTVRKILKESSLLVVPSLSESFGLVYIEALFEGTAVIGYGPTIREFHNIMGLTAKEKKLLVPLSENKVKPEFLAGKIDETFRFIQSAEGKKVMETVRKKAIRHFSWNAIIEKTEYIYQHILEGKKGITL